MAEAPAALRRALALRSVDDLRPLRTEPDAIGFVHTRYQQYFQGVKVEHGTVSTHARAGRVETWSGAMQLPAATLRVQPTLSVTAARKRAMLAMGGRQFKWQNAAEEAALRQRTGNAHATYFPTGELVVVGDFRQPEATRPLVLAWKFDVYAVEPMGRANVYIDAHTGAVVLRDNIIKHVNATGTFATRYLGPRPSSTDAFGGGFRLRETVHGKGVITMNAQSDTDLSRAVDFVDNDNNWTALEYDNANFDNAALDAHVGAQTTQDYWTTVHGRDSYDNQGSILHSFVHFGNRVDNAFWNGDEMLYGDGGGFFTPLTSVDVCGHEIGHAVCQTTANLIYQNESGAMNEGFSDIWGACVEHHLDPTKQIWLIGEDITLFGPGYLRSMSDPNTGDQPDTYLGTNWFTGPGDNGGVHTNSGVLNHWFYLLSEGGTGTNDNSTTYNVTGITIQKAARIAYRAESVYLVPSSVYADARKATLQSAIDLYGMNSAETRAVAEAWRAVGLNGNAPTFAAMAPASGAIGALITLTGTNFHTIYSITFNGTPVTMATINSTSNVVAVVPPGATTGPVVITTTQGTATSAGVFTVTGSGTAPSILSYTPAGGAPQGATVVITGTNFTGTTAVNFNGTTATFTVNSATQITATVPATATSGPLTVTSPGGTATAPTTFLVLPTLTSFAPTSGAVGTTVTLTGTSFTDVLNVKFNGVYVDAYTVNSATSITATVPLGATTGPVTVRTASGIATSPIPFTITPIITIISFSPPSGPVLTTIVTIYGAGFTGTTSVQFNGTTATTFSVASDNELWATVPAGATTGPITVTSPVGTVTSTRSFSVIVPGAPTILDFTPKLGPVGQSVAITGTDLTGATSVKFNGTPATILTNNGTSITTTVPLGATTGQISVTTALGTGVSADDFRVVIPPTNDQCSATNLPVLVCGVPQLGSNLGAGTAGDPVNGCGTTIDGAGVFYRFVGTGASVTVNTCGTATDYDGKLHVFTGTCNNLTCISGDDDGCGPGSGSSVQFISVAGTDYLIFVSGWNGAQGNFEIVVTCAAPPAPPTITNFTPAAGPIGTTVIILGSGFTGATSVQFNGTTATYNVNAAGRITATVLAGTTTGPITVTTPAGTGTSANPFTVSGPPPTLSTLSPTSGPVGTTVTVNGQNLLGASAVTFGTLAAASFSVNPAGTQLTAVVPAGAGYAQLRVTTGSGTALTAGSFCTEYTATTTGAARCGAGTLTLSAAGAPSPANRYAWYTTATGGTPIAGANGATFTTPNLTTTTTYYVAVAPDVACAGARVPVVATVNAGPAASISAGGATTFCQGDSVLLTATGGGTYQWSNGATTAQLIVRTGGSYSVTVTSNGCTATSTPVTVTVSARPNTPSISQAPQASGIVVLTSSAATGNQWYFNGTPIPGATAATYVVTANAQSGQYTVLTTNAAGCASALSAPQSVIVTGLGGDVAAAAWQLWPNPATQAVQLSGAPARSTLAVFDATGRCLRTEQTDAAGAATLDLTRLPRGVYAVRVGSQVKRLVVE